MSYPIDMLLLLMVFLLYLFITMIGIQYVEPSPLMQVYLLLSHILLTERVKDVSRYDGSSSQSECQTKSIFSYRREQSCFEIPTKELQQLTPKKPELQIHEVPTKDTPDPSQRVPSTPTPPVVQSHASFTIEFDECTPGKMKIKDHVTKFSFRQQCKPPSTEVVTTPTEVLSAESKVADWLVQSNASMMRRMSQAEDMYKTNSDPSQITKGESFI